MLQSIKRFSDQRGWLIELFRDDELPRENHPVMAYVSETKPGVARGPHEHHEQADYFAFLGPGTFAIYLWDARPESPTYGNFQRIEAGADEPATLVVPPGVVHAYQNISSENGWVFNAPNRLYAGVGKQEPVDEIRHEDDASSPFHLG
jgi:dTDP-4-dehydrorhamnose 3,5-epimerase